MTTNAKSKSAIVELKALLEDDEDRLRTLFQGLLQELLEQEMTRALVGTPGEHAPDRAGYHAGYYPRSLVTRVDKLELQVRSPELRIRTTNYSGYWQRHGESRRARKEPWSAGSAPERVTRSTLAWAGPCHSQFSSASIAPPSPWASTSTRPSVRFLTHPVRPRRSACLTVA